MPLLSAEEAALVGANRKATLPGAAAALPVAGGQAGVPAERQAQVN